MATIAKGDPDELTMHSASARFVLGPSFKVPSRTQEINHGCQCQSDERPSPDQVARIESANVQYIER
jgi:hypothetical protein